MRPLHNLGYNLAVTCDFRKNVAFWQVLTQTSLFSPPFKLRHSKWCSVMIRSLILKNELLNAWEHCRTLENVETNCWVISTYKRLTKALIRLCVFAGWSEALLVAHTTLLEIHVVAQLSSQVLLIYLKYSPHIISTHKTHRKYLSSLTSAQHIYKCSLLYHPGEPHV